MRKLFLNIKRAKTPTILQMDALECGAVALSIILGYYGHYLLPEEARQAVGVSRDGSKAINILKAARRYGMKAEGMNIESIDDVRDLEFPVIAYWAFDHFLVIEGFEKDKVYVNDPATGPRIISLSEFDENYTGIILILEPAKKFKKKPRQEASTIKQLWQKLYKSKAPFIYIILVTFLLVIPSLAVPIFAKIFIDNILIDGQKNWILPLLGGMLFTGVAMAFLTRLQKRYILRLSMKLQLTGSSEFFWHLLHLPMKFFQQRAAGDIAERVEVNEQIAEILAKEFTSNIVGAITMFLYLILMLILSWQLTIIGVTLSMSSLIVLFYINRKLTDMGRRNAQDRGKLNAIEMNGIQIMETIKANALENNFFARWAAHHAKTINSQQKIQTISVLLNIIPTILNGLTTVLLLSLGSMLIIQGKLTIGTLVALQSLLTSFNQPVSSLVNLGGEIQELRGEVVRLNDVLNQTKDNLIGQEVSNQLPIQDKSIPVIEVNSVTFGYSRLEPPIYQNFSLKIKEGERVAIVGPSGSGKSSLAKLVCGLYKPWSGEIKIKGKKHIEISRQQFSDYLALIDQKIFMFEGSVRENLSLWDPTIPDDALHTALEDAAIRDVVIDRGGLDCPVFEGGSNFSGGQCQRLEIARALVKSPHLLILDEATSAVDPITEKQIYDNLKKRNCTLFIIAHRLSTIRDCDYIAVIEDGTMTELGNHEQLMQQKGTYHQLAMLEESWE